jgi:hypothetical protein
MSFARSRSAAIVLAVVVTALMLTGCAGMNAAMQYEGTPLKGLATAETIGAFSISRRKGG